MSKTSKVPDSWAVTRVDRVGSVRTGLQRSPDRHTGRFATKYLRSANITRTGLDLTDIREMDFTPEERDVFDLQPGDILITEASGSSEQVGRAAIWTESIEGCCFQNHLIRFRPHAVAPDYALVVFRHYAASGVFARTARGVGIQHLGSSRFAALPFPVPPLAEQGRIAEAAKGKLEQMREATERLESAVRNLAEQAREIVAAAASGTLVESRGEPVADRVSSVETHVPKGMDKGSGARRGLPLRFDPVPRRWAWRTIAEVGSAQVGRQRSPAHHHGPNMRPYLRVANVFEDRIDTTDVLTMNFERGDETRYELRCGDILLNEGQSPELVGRAAIYRDEIPGACFQNTLIRFRAGRGVAPEFALLVFRRYLHSGIFMSIARWSTNIAHLGLRRFRALPFPVPPLEEQERIAMAARSRLDVTASQTSAVLDSLAKVPDMERELLAAAVNGEIVAQVSSDEPAEVLLARLGPPPSRPRAQRGTGRSTEVRNNRRSKQRSGEGAIDLAAVLEESGGALSLPELYARANFDRDQTEHVERFYLALRSQLGRSVRLAGSERENPTVEIGNAD
ncbi:MAG: restriction endonuclease subunit S [Bryobacterales bacterium]|nr:restriction endonuclease subunit S [Bryobacterales bacterium]